MANTEKKLQMEAGQTFYSMAQLTNSGDDTIYTGAASPWSGVSGLTPVVRPNGIRSGGAVTPKAGVNDTVTVAAMEVNLNGVVTDVAGDDVAITRATGNYQIHSIIVDNTGALDSVAGTVHASAFSETRGANGGPPLIAVDAVEVAQVRVPNDTAAVIAASEIKQVIGVHSESATFPLWSVNYYKGQVEFVQALDKIHTGPATKRVYCEFYTPVFTNVQRANNVQPPENSFSVNSEATYDGPVGSVSQSLGQGSFSAIGENGIDDVVVRQKGKNLWFRFYPDKFRSGHIMFQGYLGITRTFPADGNTAFACTVSAEKEAIDVAG